MYRTDEIIYDYFKQEEFNNFQFWRDPIMELTLDDFDVRDAEVKNEPSVSTQYDSFLYWREPIPELEEL